MKNDIPAFGGVASLKGFNTTVASKKLDVIYTSKHVQIYVNEAVYTNYLNYFQFNENRFLWSGGFNAYNDLINFNHNKIDTKFVLVEFSNDALSIYTDHYSRIPLFYFFDKGIFYFANSLGMLKQLGGLSNLNIDYDGLLFYYNFGFSNFNNYLKNIKSVSGGKQIVFNLKTEVIKEVSYYDIYNKKYSTDRFSNFHKNIQAIDDELFKSTKHSLANFNKVGIAISGGVDSGYLAQKINQCDAEFCSYTIGYKDGYNEFERVDYLAKVLRFKTEKIIIDEHEIIDNFLRISEYSSYPVYFNNSILNFVYKAANNDGVEVIFDGDGADRMFLGSNNFLRLKRVLSLYKTSKALRIDGFIPFLLKYINNPTLQNLRFYFLRFKQDYPFYGLRQLSNLDTYDSVYENRLNEIALPKELQKIVPLDDWHYFIMFSIFYFAPCFLHNQYEQQIRYNIVSNPQFWTDGLVDLALNIPSEQKLYKKKTKHILREAAKLNIDNRYWSLKKIGLENSFQYLKRKKTGSEFINSYVDLIKKSDEYLFLKQNVPETIIDAERLLPYYIWKQNLNKYD